MVAAAERCLHAWGRELPGRTGLLLTSASGDLGTARAINEAAAAAVGYHRCCSSSPTRTPYSATWPPAGA
ncbi:hypothetical protein ACFQ0T_01510 [Kitasatospora gansuensis]